MLISNNLPETSKQLTTRLNKHLNSGSDLTLISDISWFIACELASHKYSNIVLKSIKNKIGE